MSATRLVVERLSSEAFAPFGTFAALLPSPESRPLGAGEIIRFWPDAGGVVGLGPQGGNQAALGICQVQWRPWQIDTCEYHSFTSEGILPLDGDIMLHVGPPTGDDVPQVERLQVFYVPKGTAVVIKPGVWHHAPFAANEGVQVNTLILLPPRTYANDCVVRAVAPAVPFTV